MGQVTKANVKGYFETNDTPSEVEFSNGIDSVDYFSDDVELNITAFAGGGQANAYELSKKISVIETIGALNDSIKFPPGTTLMKMEMFNKTAGTLILYPPIGGHLNLLAANVGITVTGGMKPIGIRYDNNKWFVTV